MYPKPEVALYHDLLGEKMLANVRNDSNRDYKVSTNTGWGTVNPSARISATSHIFRDSSAEATHLFQFVNMITGLDSTGNPLRLNSYTTGGHFRAHSDSVRICSYFYLHNHAQQLPKLLLFFTQLTFLCQNDMHKDEQTALIATFMFYVSRFICRYEIQ